MRSRPSVLSRTLLGAAVALVASAPIVGLADRPTRPGVFVLGVDGMADSLAFAKRLVHETHVGLAPGSAFGPGGDGHLRHCFAASRERLSEAMDRLAPLLS